MAKSFSGGIRGLRGLRALIAGFGAVVLTTALLLPGSAGAQAVVNTVKLGACDELLGVCLANPTQRYKHGVFGQPFEYGTILTIDENGAATTCPLSRCSRTGASGSSTSTTMA